MANAQDISPYVTETSDSIMARQTLYERVRLSLVKTINKHGPDAVAALAKRLRPLSYTAATVAIVLNSNPRSFRRLGYHHDDPWELLPALRVQPKPKPTAAEKAERQRYYAARAREARSRKAAARRESRKRIRDRCRREAKEERAAYQLAYTRERRAAQAEKVRAEKQAYRERVKADPVKLEHRREMARKAHARKRANGFKKPPTKQTKPEPPVHPSDQCDQISTPSALSSTQPTAAASAGN
jgi:hypothetical protein